jgi:hypothetical protein
MLINLAEQPKGTDLGLEKAVQKSAFIKDLKRIKEIERKRRSMLIYGTEDMRTVI